MAEPVIAAHGGAGRLNTRQSSPPARFDFENGLAAALRAGQKVLVAGGSALDAVCAAVVSLEDDDHFNAGRGAVLCADGTVELSAAVMDGHDISVGAMGCLTRVRNPVLAARSLLGHRHGLLAGASADAYAEVQGLAMVDPGYFLTPQRKSQWERLRGSGAVALDHAGEADAHGTVGAVARDSAGNLAAATSTGGLANQLPGRLGDTPVVGAGTWAQNGVCALSATGTGDAFARVAFARRIADLIEIGGLDAGDAAVRTLQDVVRVGGEGGCILLGADGEIHCPFNTPQMLRGWALGASDPVVGIKPGETVTVG